MAHHVRRTPVPVALWALFVLVLGVVCGTGPAAGTGGLPAAALPAVASATGPAGAAGATGTADRDRPAFSAPVSPHAADHTRAQGLHASAVVQHTRMPGLPGAVPGPVTGPLAVPLPPGELAGPRQERAPPAAAPSSRRTRGPPSTRSI
ncbi:hypothetical protein [Streptomyces hiroshimensis]|uniref:Secreted protein n=1 Tax=Streptomyces hiroshimensis TaxID=66424 RepID=A0ABQ2YWM7_9ACTN|nr:hypothetical protein [Streptomyces hiroshimensis]GGX97814.1 hypothetical protein GCM10010324_50100 [Streptomyces hiroshimensis]